MMNQADGYTYCGTIFILPDESSATAIENALNHLIDKINKDSNYFQTDDMNDPVGAAKENFESSPNAPNAIYSTNSNIIKFKRNNGGTFVVPIVINGALKLDFIFDSGASDVSISPDVALTLIRTGTVTESDFVGTQKYVFADGSIANSNVFIIREIQIGNKVEKNVKASISNSIDAPLLLGQSILSKFGKLTIDNANNTLTIE